MSSIIGRTMNDISEKTIGENIRNIRKQAGITLDALADKVGITKSALSKIETGKTSTPVTTLLRIARALSVEVTNFFVSRERRPAYALTRKGFGQIVTRNGSKLGYTYEALAHDLVEKLAEPFLCTIDKNDKIGDFQHTGEEFLYVISGKLQYKVGDEILVLGAGDCLYFDSAIVHSLKALSEKPVKLLFVMIAPFPRIK